MVEKKKKEKKKKECRKTATVTSGDGRHGDPSLGPQNAIIIPIIIPAVRPMGADSILSQVNRPSGSGVAPPQSPTAFLRPVPTTGQVSQP